MTVVVGTAGHIDHGKTTLLRALTGIDADRLPEERARGMTIDVGYAHLALDDGTSLDFVDVPGHDRLVGNMLVGAGEVDVALLVVAADDGPRAQTAEHVALLDGLGISDGLVVITKSDAVDAGRLAEVTAAVGELLQGTSLAGCPVVAASSTTGDRLDRVRTELIAARDRHLAHDLEARPPCLAIDRVFRIKGRGLVVTGTLRGGPLARGDNLRVMPSGGWARIREIQVHGVPVDRVTAEGRTALNLVGVEAADIRRGMVLTTDTTVSASDRLLVELTRPLPDRSRVRLHLGTAAVDATVQASGRDGLTLPNGRSVALLRLSAPIPIRPGDRCVLRGGAAGQAVGGVALEPEPARGASRRRQSVERIVLLASAVERLDAPAVDAARLDLHGVCPVGPRVRLAADIAATANHAAVQAVAGNGADVALLDVRSEVARSIRGSVTVRWDDALSAATEVVERLVDDGRLVREGDRVRDPAVAPSGEDPVLAAAMDRLEAALSVTAPPPLAAAARSVGCPPAAVRTLERNGRIIVLEPDLAYAAATYRELTERALAMAARGGLTPAAFRDATGTSRKYVMAILEDLDRRAILRRTPYGHVPGPRAPSGIRSG